MALFHDHHDRWRGPLTGISVGRVFRRMKAALNMIHVSIAAAKIRRLRSELQLHGHNDWARLNLDEQDLKVWDVRIPRRPLILGDKWDS